MLIGGLKMAGRGQGGVDVVLVVLDFPLRYHVVDIYYQQYLGRLPHREEVEMKHSIVTLACRVASAPRTGVTMT
jgi:hypothetical protein